MAEDKKAATRTEQKNRYNAENYDSLRIVVPKGRKAVMQNFAATKGKSLNKFVNEAIDEKIEREKR